MCKWFAGGLPCPHWDKYGKCKNMHSSYIRNLHEMLTGEQEEEWSLQARITIKEDESEESARIRMKEKMDKAMIKYPERLTYKEHKQVGEGENYW